MTRTIRYIVLPGNMPVLLLNTGLGYSTLHDLSKHIGLWGLCAILAEYLTITSL